MSNTHVLPRAYIWGFADTIRGGVEGRAVSRLAFGRLYYAKVPKYFFPGVIAVKLPVGLSLLVLIGISLFLARRLPPEWMLPVGVLLLASLWFLVVLSFGSPYAGIRHALPVVALLAVMAGLSTHAALDSKSKLLKLTVPLALVAAGVSALPVMRPWEYYNEIFGGSSKAYLFFNDEGIDLCQRGKEIVRYYREVLQPAGELPYLYCCFSPDEAKARGFDFLGNDLNRDKARLESTVTSGTILTNARDLGKHLWWDVTALREATPVARFGNLLVFRGTFYLPTGQAEGSYSEALEKLYAEKPDLETAERFLKQSAVLDPNAFFVNIELGNVCLKRGSREDALHAYTAALDHAPNDREMRRSIQEQIQRVLTKPLDKIPALRNPQLE